MRRVEGEPVRRVIVQSAHEEAATVEFPEMDGTMRQIPGRVDYEVTVRVAVSSREDYEWWRARVGRTLAVEE